MNATTHRLGLRAKSGERRAESLTLYFLLSAWCSSLYASAPNPGIDGPTQAPVYTLLEHRVAGDWQSALWDVEPPLDPQTQWKISSDGLGVLWTAPPGRYTLRAIAVHWNDKRIAQWRLVVVVGEKPPEPKPPEPEPEPKPPGPPEPQNAWRQWARQKATELVDGPSRQAEAQAVAGAFRAAAAGAKAGQFSNPRQAREFLRTQARQALGTLEAVGRWQKFSDAVDWQLDGLSAQGKLSTLDQYAELWQAMALGLEEVR